MQSKYTLKQGYRNLKSIISELSDDFLTESEAQVRISFLDRLLFEALGWSVPDIRVEDYDDKGGRIDYKLGSRPHAILEAKKAATNFLGIPKQTRVRVRDMQSLIHSSKAFKDAVIQCIEYCALEGAKIGVVSNGHQIALFQALNPDMPPLQGECFFFNGIEQIEEEFTLLWNLLSPEGIAEGRAYRDISLHRNPRIPSKASVSINDPFRPRYPDPFQENIRAVSELLLSEIDDNLSLRSQFYKDCYVKTDANARHLNLSKRIIEGRYGAVTSGARPKPLEPSLRSSDDIFEVGHSSSPIVVLGDVGVGKTSFFENLYFETAASSSGEFVFLHVNLARSASLTDNVKDFIISEVPRLLRKNYDINISALKFVEAVHYQDIMDFDETPDGSLKDSDPQSYKKERIKFIKELTSNAASHLIASLAHLHYGQQRKIIIVIDNADQRSYQDQQEAFLAAEELSRSTSALVFVALRPSTFYLSKKTGALSGYQNRAFSVLPPPVDEVISRRLVFAIRVAEGEEEVSSLDRVRFKLGGIIHFMNATHRSIKNNKEIRDFLQNISGGNVRSIVELVSSFFGSLNVDSEKIIRIEEEKGNYKVPLHEFTKHALLGEYAHYNPQSSLYASNVYDISSSDQKEHFLCPLIISFLRNSTGRQDRDGFVAGDHLIHEMLKVGFTEDQTCHALRKMAENRLIETPHSHFREIEASEATSPSEFPFRVTSIGVYHVQNWMCTFSYLDAVSIDTPIFDPSVRGLLHELAGSFAIEHRLERSINFLAYLESAWEDCAIDVSYFNFLETRNLQASSFDPVKKFVAKRNR